MAPPPAGASDALPLSLHLANHMPANIHEPHVVLQDPYRRCGRAAQIGIDALHHAAAPGIVTKHQLHHRQPHCSGGGFGFQFAQAPLPIPSIDPAGIAGQIAIGVVSHGFRLRRHPTVAQGPRRPRGIAARGIDIDLRPLRCAGERDAPRKEGPLPFRRLVVQRGIGRRQIQIRLHRQHHRLILRGHAADDQAACIGPAGILIQIVDGVSGGVCCGRADVLVGRGGEAIAKLVIGVADARRQGALHHRVCAPDALPAGDLPALVLSVNPLPAPALAGRETTDAEVRINRIDAARDIDR